MRKAALASKQQQQGGSSTSASKFATKGTLKRKNNSKDDCPNKKGTGLSVGNKQLKLPSPPKPSHRVGKGLMIGKGPVVLSTVCRLLMHKDHAFEMVNSIIKETDLDPYAIQTMKDLGSFGLFDLSRVRSSQVLSLCNFYSFFL